jgi:hypothetical protein
LLFHRGGTPAGPVDKIAAEKKLTAAFGCKLRRPPCDRGIGVSRAC